MGAAFPDMDRSRASCRLQDLWEASWIIRRSYASSLPASFAASRSAAISRPGWASTTVWPCAWLRLSAAAWAMPGPAAASPAPALRAARQRRGARLCGAAGRREPPLRRSLPPGAWQPAVPRHPRHRHLVPRRHGPGLCAGGLQHCLRAAGGPHMRAAGVRLGQAIEAAGAQQRRSSLPGTLRSPRRRPCAPRRRGQMKKGRSLKGPGLRLSVIKKC